MGKGKLLDKDLENLAVDIAYHTHKGPNVHVTADVASGDFDLAVKSKEDHLLIAGTAKSLKWWEADITTNVDMYLEQREGMLTG